MDRTDEFLQTVQRVCGGTRVTLAVPTGGGDPSLNALIAEISTDINITQLKLSELSKLNKQRGLFNDKTAQIQQLSNDVKEHITEMNSKLELVEMKATRFGTQHTATHYQNTAETLRNKLLQATSQFKQVLQARTENMKTQNDRRNLYSSSATNRFDSSSLSFANSSASSFDVERGEQSLFQRVHYSQERAEGVENVQRMIGELGQIFQKVASMVAQHDEFVQRIDEDIDSSLHNVAEGQNELLNYFHRISSNRSLILKVFAVLLAFVIFFVLFLT